MLHATGRSSVIGSSSFATQVFYSVRSSKIFILCFLFISPSFSFPPHINPVAYQQLLSQQRGLSAFGHTPPLIQPSPSSFSARQHPLSASAMSAALNSSSSDANQVGKGKQPPSSGALQPAHGAKSLHVTRRENWCDPPPPQRLAGRALTLHCRPLADVRQMFI